MSKRKKHEEAEHENTERWAVSYLDMVTVMMCLFIVLYAMSSVDQVKYNQLASSLAQSFGDGGGGSSQVLDGGDGILTKDVPVTQAADEAGGNQDGNVGDMLVPEQMETVEMRAARQEVSDLSSVQEQIESALIGTDNAGNVSFKSDERGLLIGLVSTDVFFQAESSRLTEHANETLAVIAPVLGNATYNLAVEGHANTLPTTRYASNWELSSERATTVLRQIQSAGPVDPGRLRAVGMGDAHPVQDPGVDPIIANRRVDIIVMSAAPEDVRNLIPDVVAEGSAAA